MFDVDQQPGSTGSTFIVRIWLEWSRAGSCWRGQIIHVQSGEKVAFLCLNEMFGFIQGYISMPKIVEGEPTRDV